MDVGTLTIIASIVSLITSLGTGAFVLIQHCLPERLHKCLSKCCNSELDVK